MNTPPTQHLTQRKKLIEFGSGFAGWVLINTAIWLLAALMYGDNPLDDGVFLISGLMFLANLAVLIGLSFTRRWIALGLLVALAVNLLASVILQVFYMGTCAIPVTLYWLTDKVR
jgi:hypothetical protein